MNRVHGSKMFRTPDGVFPDDCPCSVTRRRGFADGTAGHPPAEVTVDYRSERSEEYLQGYERGLDEKERR